MKPFVEQVTTAYQNGVDQANVPHMGNPYKEASEAWVAFDLGRKYGAMVSKTINPPTHFANIRGVRVAADNVIISVNGGNYFARDLCACILRMKERAEAEEATRQVATKTATRTTDASALDTFSESMVEKIEHALALHTVRLTLADHEAEVIAFALERMRMQGFSIAEEMAQTRSDRSAVENEKAADNARLVMDNVRTAQRIEARLRNLILRKN